MQRKTYFEVRIERLKCCGVFLRIDRIEPHFFLQRLGFNHRRVMRGVCRAEAGSERTHALFAIHLQIQDVNDERVAGLRAVDIEGTGQWVVSFDQGKRISRLLQRIAKTVERVGLQNVARLHAGHWRRNSEQVLYVVNRRCIAHHVLFRRRWIALCGQACKTKEKNESNPESHEDPHLKWIATKCNTGGRYRQPAIGRNSCSVEAYGFSHLTAEM